MEPLPDFLHRSFRVLYSARADGVAEVVLHDQPRLIAGGWYRGWIQQQNEDRPAAPPASGIMKSLTEYLTFNIPTKMGFVNITPQVEEVVRRSGVAEGFVLCNSMHITASVFVNDDEAGLHHDFGKWLEGLAPFNPDPAHYHHNRTGEDNADAHLKRQIMGREVVVAITKGKLDFGPWEQIFYGEFDGHRAKRILVKIIGE